MIQGESTIIIIYKFHIFVVTPTRKLASCIFTVASVLVSKPKECLALS